LGEHPAKKLHRRAGGGIMATAHDCIRIALDRRTFLVASGIGYCGLHLPSLASAAAPTTNGPQRKTARSTLLIWLSGGASHIDTWDMKPDAPAEYRGDFKSITTSAPAIRLCEHLPLLAKQAHNLVVVRSLGHYGRGTGDHHAGYYYNLTGHEPDPTFRALLNDRKPLPGDWPFIGSVVAAKRPVHPYLPQLISLPEKPGFPQYTRPGQFAARLGLEYDPVYVMGKLERPTEFIVPSLALEGDVDVRRLQSRRDLLHVLDNAERLLEKTTDGLSRQQEKAFALLTSPQSKSAFDLTKEPLAVREKYGATINGMSMLMARRLVEAAVPFVTVFWMGDPKLDAKCKSGGGWDTHGNNFNCLRDNLLPEFDRAFAALLGDLDDRGLLDETLIVVTSEMGRHPKIGDVRSGGLAGGGRDHWTNCMSVLFAGGGTRGGQTYGSSDKIAAYPDTLPTAPEDIAKTIYHAMGIEDLETVDREGKPFQLLEDGTPLKKLF
jgi:hypothetical protein